MSDVAHAPLGGAAFKGVAARLDKIPRLPHVGGLGVVGAILHPGKQVQRARPPGEELHAGHRDACAGLDLPKDVGQRRRRASHVVHVVEQHGVDALRQRDLLGRRATVPDVVPALALHPGRGLLEHLRALLEGQYAAGPADRGAQEAIAQPGAGADVEHDVAALQVEQRDRAFAQRHRERGGRVVARGARAIALDRELVVARQGHCRSVRRSSAKRNADP